jgi:IS5 family transposase
VEETLDTVQVNDAQMMRLIADKAYDSAPLHKRLAEQNIEQITPHKRNRVKKKLQDGRPLRRYKRRWIIERTIRLARQLPSHRHPVRPLYQPIHHIRSHRLHHHHNEVHGLMKPLLASRGPNIEIFLQSAGVLDALSGLAKLEWKGEMGLG